MDEYQAVRKQMQASALDNNSAESRVHDIWVSLKAAEIREQAGCFNGQGRCKAGSGCNARKVQ